MKEWILAARPKTLPAAVVPVWLGGVLSWSLSGQYDWFLGGLTLVGAVAIQVATNFFNDAIDAQKGADTEQRLGPRRATASGRLRSRSVFGAAFLFLFIAAVAGAFLTQARGGVILAIGLPSLYLSYGYTGGPVPLAYRGLGELFVILFFGLVAVMGTVFIQLHEWRGEAALLGLQLGLLSALLISINNIRDREEDRQSEKSTLAVKLGEKRAKGLLVAMWLGVVLCAPFWHLFHLSELRWASLPVVILGVLILPKILRESPSARYNKYLAVGGVQLLLFGAAFHFFAIG